MKSIARRIESSHIPLLPPPEGRGIGGGLLLLSLLLLLTLPGFSQLQFQAVIGTAASNDGVGVLPVDGGYIISYTGDTGAYPPWTPKSYILKTDSLLNPVWLKTYEKQNYCNSAGVIMQNPDSSYFLSATYDTGSISEDCFMKIDSTGDTLWTKSGVSPEIMYKNPDGGYTLSQGPILIRIDSSFNVLWRKFYYGIYRPAQQTDDGGYILMGYITNFNLSKVLVTKTDSMGTVQWSKTYQITNPANYVAGYGIGNHVIQQTSDGGYVFVGGISDTITWYSEILVVKTDSVGNIQWAKTYGGGNGAGGVSIEENNGKYILIAVTRGVESPQNGNRTTMLRLDPSGNLFWGMMYGSVVTNPWLNDEAYVVAHVPGGYMFSGATESLGPGNPVWDGWLVKTNSSGVSGCNEIATSPIVGVPTIIVGPGYADSLWPLITLTSCAPLTIGTYLHQDSILCGNLPLGIQIQGVKEKEDITVFPNPTSGKFTIQLATGNWQLASSQQRASSIEIHNVLGEKVFEMAKGQWLMVRQKDGLSQSGANGNTSTTSTINHQTSTIDISSHPIGMYFLHIRTEEGMAVKKVIVSR